MNPEPLNAYLSSTYGLKRHPVLSIWGPYKEKADMKMWMDPATCRGCLRCELACSFHHSGHTAFNPELSSTRVFRSNDTKAIRMALNDSCDHCDNENFPMCIRACVFGARGIVRERSS